MKELRYSAREFQPRNNRSMMQAFDTLLSVKIVRRTTHSRASILFFHRIEQNVVALDDLQRDDVILSGYERSKDVIRRLYYVYQYFLLICSSLLFPIQMFVEKGTEFARIKRANDRVNSFEKYLFSFIIR